MSELASLRNRQIRLANRPVGLPTAREWESTTEPVGEPEAGGVLVQTLLLSLDPAMRGWMNEGKSYIAPVGIGEVMRAGGIGRVIASNNPQFAAGDYVAGGFGVQEYCLVDPAKLTQIGLAKIDLRMGTLAQWLNA